MQAAASFTSIHLYVGAVDFRKSIDGLSYLVEAEMSQNPFTLGSIYIFVNRDRNRMKCLYWDKTGFALWFKRLEKNKFPWVKRLTDKNQCEPPTISARELSLLLDGIDIFKIKPHQTLNYNCVI